jgi:enamine deaminase RidA (YjgF/YER057c/UK114 family)
MNAKIKLQRSQPAQFLPAPRAVRAGDYIFTSSIYPIDQSGHAITIDDRLGRTGPTLIEMQTRHCLETLKGVLKEFGGSLDRVLKADVHLIDPADFYEFKLVWREYFPVDPPARTTVEVGETLPMPGARLNIDAVALAGDSNLTRQVLRDPDGYDPLEAEWASPAVRAGNFVFCSGFAASDFRNGLAVRKRLRNYGNDAELQAEYIFTYLNRVLAQVDTSLEYAVESQVYEPDLITFHDVDRVWGRYLPLPPPRSSMGIKGLLVPGAVCMANLTVLIPDKNHTREESKEGIRWHPATERKVNFSPTIKAGEWRFIAGQAATPDFWTVKGAPTGLPNHFSDIEMQTRFTMEMLTEQLEANETDWDHCHHVRVWLINPDRDYRGFVRVWRECFPDLAKAPALAFVPCTQIMIPGLLIEIDPTCVARE